MQQRHPHTVYQYGKTFDSDDMQCEKAGAGQNDHIAVIDAEIFGNTDKIHTDSGNKNAEPLQFGNGFVYNKPEKGHDNDIERSNKTGFADSGMADTDLLQSTGDSQHDTADDAAGNKVLPFCFVISTPNRKGLPASRSKRRRRGSEKPRRSMSGGH